MVSKTKTSLPSPKQPSLLTCIPIHLENSLTRTKSLALKHHPDKEDLIEKLWKATLVLLPSHHQNPPSKKSTSSTPESAPKNNWMTLNDKLNSSDVSVQNTIPTLLLQMLLQESISKERDFKPFWTTAYKELSEKLLSPTEIDSVDSDMNSSSLSSRKPEAKSSLLTIQKTQAPNKNSQRTYSPLSTSTVVDRWASEAIPTGNLKTLSIKLKPTPYQKNILMGWMNTSRFIYNKSVESINNKENANWKNMRDAMVTANTKKTHPVYQESTRRITLLRTDKSVREKELKAHRENLSKEAIREMEREIHQLKTEIQTANATMRNAAKQLPSTANETLLPWELETPKEIRTGAIKEACSAYKSGISNLKAGNIKFFSMKFRKKTSFTQGISLPKSFITNLDGVFHIAKTFFKGNNHEFPSGKRTKKKHRNLVIQHDCRLIKKYNEFWLLVPVDAPCKKKEVFLTYGGVDPGVKTFLTVFENEGCTEYKVDSERITRINKKIDTLKGFKRVRKKHFLRYEKKKGNLIKEIHWKSIRSMLTNWDVLFFGDIKSHGISSKGNNKKLHRDINDLKFYQFKQRLQHQAMQRGNKVFFVNEAYTSKTCSCCGGMYDVGISRVYECEFCKKKLGRDENASKNILMKGILSILDDKCV